MTPGGLARELAALVPPGGVSFAEADLFAAGVDLWPRHLVRLWEGRTPALPLAVVWPERLEEVQAVIALARERGLALVPYGAGSSVVGGATADAGTVVLDLKRMARIVAIDEEALTATAEAGIMGELFERALERRGFTEGHFPSSIYCSTLGGWIAARGAGQMSSRYGKIEDHVLGGTVVLGDGSVVRQAPSPVRSAMLDTLIGSEGTLGVWTEATVRIHRLPEARAFRGFELPGVAEALGLAEAWLRAGLSPAVVRIYDPVDSLLHRDTSGDERPHERGPSRSAWAGARFPRLLGAAADLVGRKCRAVVVLQGSEDTIGRDQRLLLELAEGHRARDLGPAPGEAWWRTRYRVSYRQSNAFRAGVAVDTMEVACTWDRILGVYEAVRRAGRAVGAQVLAHFSHVYLEGASIYFTYALPARGGEQAYDRLWEAALAAAVSQGGNVSHHHGIGRLKARAFRAALGGALPLLRAQAAALDPGGVLNPGVLVKRDGASDATAGPDAAAAAAGTSAVSTERAGGSAAEGRSLAQPAPGALLAVVAPGESAGAVERRIAARALTLGPMAAAHPDLSVLELARRGWLWHKSGQLHLVEPLVMGVDGAAAGQPFRYIPAPRAAMGSELWRALADADVQRVWLRCAPLPSEPSLASGPLASCLAAVRELARDEDLGCAQLSLAAAGERAVVRVEAPAGPLASERRIAAGARLRRHGLTSVEAVAALPAELRDAIGGGPDAALPPDAVLVTGRWSGVDAAAIEAAAAGLGVRLLLVDGAGAVGFLGPVERGSGWDRERALAIVSAREVGLEVERTKAPGGHAAAGEGPSVAAAAPAGIQEDLRRAATPEAHGAPSGARARLALAPHVHELDNCTYCPKLCRFSCPVAVADGSETLTPRQLVLAASLDRRGARPLDRDAAARLYACVDCRGCRSFCDHDNDVATVLMDARAELYDSGRVPEPVRAALAALARDGRLAGTAAYTPPAGDGGGDTVVFFGCQGEGRDDALRRTTLDLVESRFGRARSAALEPRCCGLPLWRWGDRQGFARHARRLARALEGAARVIVDDGGCAWALRELYPRVGVEVPEVVTVAALLGPGDVAIDDPAGVAPHDDEWAVRWLGEPTLRARLGLPLGRGSVLEGEAGSCGGSLLEVYDPLLARRVARLCADDLVGGGAARILAASPTCRRRLRAAGAAPVDVVELWAQKMARTPAVGST